MSDDEDYEEYERESRKRKEVELLIDECNTDPANKKLSYPSFVDRYFTKYYKCDFKYPGNDQLLLLHSNRVVILGVAQSHAVTDPTKYRIKSVVFLQKQSDKMSGKHKKFANVINFRQPFCKIECEKLTETPPVDHYFLIFSLMNAKLVEVNENLVTNPELIQKRPESEGFLAIIYPKLSAIRDQISENCITHAEYVEVLRKRKEQPETSVVADTNPIESEALSEDNGDKNDPQEEEDEQKQKELMN